MAHLNAHLPAEFLVATPAHSWTLAESTAGGLDFLASLEMELIQRITSATPQLKS